jgi:hypothetical protein
MGRTHPNLVGHWRFENNLLDSSGNGNDGAVGAGSAAYARGKVGQAWDSNATRYIDATETTSKLGSIAISAWLRPTWTFTSSAAVDDRKTIISNITTSNLADAVYIIHANEDGRIDLIWRNNADTGFNAHITDDVVLAKDTWSHFAMVSESGVAPVFYIDGKAVSSNTRVGIGTESGSKSPNLLIMGAPIQGVTGGALRRWIGQLDDVQIWNRALQPHHIRAIYNGVDPAFIGDVA